MVARTTRSSRAAPRGPRRSLGDELGQGPLDQALAHVPADGGLHGLAQGGVVQAELAGRPGAVVEVGVPERADRLAAQLGLAATDPGDGLGHAGHPHGHRQRQGPGPVGQTGDDGDQVDGLGVGQRVGVEHVAVAGPALGLGQQVAVDAVEGVADPEPGRQVERQPAVQVADEHRRRPGGPPRALHRAGVDDHHLDRVVAEGDLLALELGAGVVGGELRRRAGRLVHEGAAVPTQGGRRAGVDHPPHPGPAGRLQHVPGALDIDLVQRGGVGQAELVHAGHVVHDPAAVGRPDQGLLVVEVADGQLDPGVGQPLAVPEVADQGPHRPPLGHQPGDQQAADEPGGSGDQGPLVHRPARIRSPKRAK